MVTADGVLVRDAMAAAHCASVGIGVLHLQVLQRVVIAVALQGWGDMKELLVAGLGYYV